MTETIKIRKQRLYDLTTKARKEFFEAERKAKYEVRKAHPELKWFEQMDEVEKNPEVIKANARLLALCDACNLMGIECGE